MDSHKIDLYLGIDVQIKRGCSYYVINAGLEYVISGWLRGDTHDDICHQLSQLVKALRARITGAIAVGIDAPRMGLPAPRTLYWRGGKWEPASAGVKGFGRHCEVVIKALGIANPQWTRLAEASPPWMVLGYRLFQTLQDVEFLYEVFPSASYAMLAETEHAPVALSFAAFANGPKDMLDACISAYTVHAYLQGLGCEVGGGDGLGSIILPRSLPVVASHPVLHWPGQN